VKEQPELTVYYVFLSDCIISNLRILADYVSLDYLDIQGERKEIQST
jgi:hypothetical protein